MNRIVRILSRMLGFFGGIATIYLLCVTHPSTDLKMDYIGFIIGILAILVTLLVAWNIYNAIGVEQRMNDVQQHLIDYQSEQKRSYEDFRQEISSKIESIHSSTSSQIEQQIKIKLESAKYAYITLFNATQAQVSALHNDNDYLQQYAYYQNALDALLKCRQFPSNIVYNIKELIGMMDDILKMREKSDSVNDKLQEEYKEEFIQTMEDISKSSRDEFSFENRQKFMEIATKAKQIYENTNLE